MNCTLANSLWLAGCAPELARFHRATKHVAKEQRSLLLAMLAANANTEFGRKHSFASIRSVREYQQRVPLHHYEDYREWIERITANSSGILTNEPVVLFEPTSGSSTATKLIPYTASLRRQFQRGIRSWIADLFLHRPELLSGQAYWSVTPAGMPHLRTSNGIPIGFDEDAAYVGGWQQRMVRSIMAVPGSIRHITDMDTFVYLTLLLLIRTRNLRLISVWNPTFLSLLVDRLPEYGDRLVADLEHGSTSISAPLSNDVLHADLHQLIQPAARRAAELREALRCGTSAERHACLWPHLSLISCWSDANAVVPAARLKALFPQAEMQGKGLLATEGFVSFPLANYEGSALAVRTHFLEFLPGDSTEKLDLSNPLLAHELVPGQRYTVVITTGGGLYRYQLDDMVEVVGRIRSCPTVRFIGRRGYVSDWFGEKLSEVHVAEILRTTFHSLGIEPAFAMLACDTDIPCPSYVLYIDSIAQDDTLTHAAAKIEEALLANFHYKYGRSLGQLNPVRVFRACDAAESFLRASVQRGQRAGCIKPLALDRHDGWSRKFRGQFVAESVLR